IYRDNWWQYAEKRPAMLKAIRDLDRVLVVALVSRTVMPVLVPTGQVFSHMLGVFASRSTSSLALLNSSIHYAWATARASSLKGDLRYTPSDVYETMPQPRSTEEMKRAGQQLEEFRDDLMKARNLGLTKLYGLFHSPSEVGADVNRLRSLHYEIDLAVAEAYGWGDLNIEPAFNATRQGIRFSMDPRVRVEVLDRMLELNHNRQATAKTERKLSGNARAPLEEPGGDRLF
ncbi:type IIL restriction-modification enzyme MmeI, partial [Streptomyces cyaneofuscatus]|uniref:type IIL restriction-modification enzyme MmeI n=1 Tax=Streptomyces cyaneofuscatus TaxID=66883 RepID=UPI0037F51D28